MVGKPEGTRTCEGLFLERHPGTQTFLGRVRPLLPAHLLASATQPRNPLTPLTSISVVRRLNFHLIASTGALMKSQGYQGGECGDST